jgi:hydrogenase maturation protease
MLSTPCGAGRSITLRQVEYLSLPLISPELAATIADARLVVFIDACVGTHPGMVSVHTPIPEDTGDYAFSHGLTPARLLAWAQKLYGHCPEALVFTVTGQDFGYREGLSPSVKAALPALLAEIRRAVRLNGRRSPAC